MPQEKKITPLKSTDAKSFNKILAKQIQQNISHDLVKFIPRIKLWLNIHESVSVIHQTNNM